MRAPNVEHSRSNSKVILIDDAGWGDLILGVVIGALELPSHRYLEHRIPLTSFQAPLFDEKRYLKDAIIIVKDIIDVTQAGQSAVFKVCSGYVLSTVRAYLRKQGFRVEETVITGFLQERVERGFVQWCKEIGVPSELLSKNKRDFWKLLSWVQQSPVEREKFVKTGWRSWQKKWRAVAYQKVKGP